MGNSETKTQTFHPVLQAVIVSSKTENGKYTVYVIQVTTNIGKWIVQRRYAEFNSLHQALTRNFPDQEFPSLPEKKVL